MKHPIYIDIDDVISQTGTSFLKLLKEKFNRVINYEDITAFDLKESFKLNDEELSRFMELAHQPKELMAIPPFPEAVKNIRSWHEQNIPIFIITGRPFFTYEITLKWLTQHQVPFQKLFFVNKYAFHDENITHSNYLTLDQLRQMNFSVAIEDSGKMANLLAEEMQVPVYLLDRPWNRLDVNPSLIKQKKIIRCKDWQPIIQHINKVI